MNIDFQIARSLQLLKSPELAPFMEYLKAERADALEKAATHVELLHIAREQGKAQFLKQLLEYVSKSDTLASKLR